MNRFKSVWDAQWSLSAHDQVANLFRIPYPEPAIASARRAAPEHGLAVWREISNTAAAIAA